MMRGILLAALIVALPLAQAAAQNGGAPPLDTFTAQYGYPTFPVAPEYDVPYIWTGPDYDTLRIGDLTMLPTLNQAAPPGASRSTGSVPGSSVPGILSHP